MSTKLESSRSLRAPEREALRRGARVAERFVIEGLAAAGGMSLVYRALDLETSSRVALKLLSRRDPTTHLRFEREAEILQSLAHPAIVRYVGHGCTHGDTLFLAMEWLEGEDLATRLSRAPIRTSECLALMRQLCAALTAAHARGVLHRDIKPSNVFVLGSLSSVKLLDFGVARGEVGTARLTKAGTLIGTVGYMAPEQARGALDLDVRADVFALGSLLFECLTGQPVFAGAHDLEVLAKVLREEPPRVSALRPDLGPPFDALLSRLLAKDRDARPASAAHALAEIERAYEGHTFDEQPEPLARARTSYAEQRILSVIIGRPRGRASEPSEAWQALASELGAQAVTLSDGALLFILTAATAGTVVDQAAHAARCALALARDRPDLAIGLATGAVDITSSVPVGSAIDRATALLHDRAPEIRLDALTAGLLGSRFAVRTSEHGLVLEGEREEIEPSDVLMGKTSPFVGRAKELTILHATLRACMREERARAVLVTGPPGAGKSRLGREFVERARHAQDVRVLFACADPTTAGSPLSLVQRLLRNAASLRAGMPSDVQRDMLRTYLTSTSTLAGDEQTFEFLCEILGVGREPPASALLRAARSDPEVMREQKRRAFERWTTAVLERGPLLVLLEDLHWGDLPSITYVQRAVRTLETHGLFVLATARPELHAEFPRLREEGVFEELCLHGLTRRASEQLARSVLPKDTPDAVIANVVALASGNAFYLEELVRRVAEGGGAELPETVVAMAQSRIESLPPEARRLLRAASVFGESAWEGGVQHLLASDGREGFLVDGLVRQEIVLPRLDSRFPGEREFGFRHALLREAAYAMLPDADRKSGHLRAAEWLEARGERDARVLARHFERGGAIARALPHIARASMAALDSGDFESAIALSQRGASLGAYGDQRGMLLLVRAYASTWRCDPELPGEALSLLPRATAPWWLALSLHVFGSALLGTPERAEPYLQLALTTAPDIALTSAYGHAIHVLSTGAALLGRAPIGWALVEQFERASRAREAESDPAFLAWFNLAKCILASNSLLDRERWALGRAIAWGHASVDAMRVLGSGSGEAAALFHLGNAYWLAGDFARSLSLLQHALDVAKQTGNVLVEEHATLLLAVAALRDDAHARARTILSSLAGSSNVQLSHAAAAILADSLCRDGKLEQAIEQAQAATTGCSLMYRRTACGTLARAQLARGRYDEALAATERALSEGGPDSFPHLTVDLLGSRALALLGRGRVAEARGAVLAAARLRESASADIDDEANRRVFRSRGRANRVLDQLARDLLPAHPG